MPEVMFPNSEKAEKCVGDLMLREVSSFAPKVESAY